MRKTVKWIFSILIFSICFGISFGKVSEVLRKKAGGSSDMIHSFYELERDCVDVLVLGSSHAYSSFAPDLLWRKYGYASCLLASERQTLAMSYYLLREALEYQKPKVVLLEAYYAWFDGKYTDMNQLAIDAMRNGAVKEELLQDLFGDLDWKQKLEYAVPFVRYHSRWTELEDSDFNPKTYHYGAMINYNMHPLPEPAQPEQPSDIPEVNLEYLGKIQDICKENDISLIFYTAPYGYEKNESVYLSKQAIALAVVQYAQAQDIPFYAWQAHAEELGFCYETDFRDEGHLNGYGAQKMTDALGTYLTEICELTDHRGDEQYVNWEKAAERCAEERKMLSDRQQEDSDDAK